MIFDLKYVNKPTFYIYNENELNEYISMNFEIRITTLYLGLTLRIIEV